MIYEEHGQSGKHRQRLEEGQREESLLSINSKPGPGQGG